MRSDLTRCVGRGFCDRNMEADDGGTLKIVPDVYGIDRRHTAAVTEQ
jgi:hypothetical protein